MGRRGGGERGAFWALGLWGAMAGGDVEAPGRAGGGGAGARAVLCHLAAAVLGLVAVVCAGTWLGVLPGAAGHAMNYLFTAATMLLSYNVSGCFREANLLFKGGSSTALAPVTVAIILRVRVLVMYLAFGGGAVGAGLATGLGSASGSLSPRIGASPGALDAAVVFIFLAWFVNQLFFVFPLLDFAARGAAGKISAHPEGKWPSIDQVCSDEGIAFWNEYAPGVAQLMGGGGAGAAAKPAGADQPKSVSKSPSRAPTFD